MALIYISLGSNIEPQHYLTLALNDLSDVFEIVALSPVYESESVGFAGDNFLNMVVAAKTTWTIEQTVAEFKQIESRHGRILGAKKFSSRTVDIDLLLYDDLVCQLPIVLPRAEVTENAFVLWPLADIAPQMCHPGTHQTYQELWQAYDKNKQQLWPIEFNWVAPQ